MELPLAKGQYPPGSGSQKRNTFDNNLHNNHPHVPSVQQSPFDKEQLRDVEELLAGVNKLVDEPTTSPVHGRGSGRTSNATRVSPVSFEPTRRSSRNEVLLLNVGGKSMSTYRSTLTQYEGSMLATMVSDRWTEGCTQDDGSLFLDMDPDLFKEILTALRHRAIGQKRMIFTHKAAVLAQYLGLPVDGILDVGPGGSPAYITATYTHKARIINPSESPTQKDPKMCHGMMFNVYLNSPLGCVLTAFDVYTRPKAMFGTQDSSPSVITVHAKQGRFTGQDKHVEGWHKVHVQPLVDGHLRILLPEHSELTVEPGKLRAIRLWCDGGVLQYSEREPVEERSCDEMASVPYLMELSISPGQVTGPSARDSMQCGCFFVGAIEYRISL